MSLHGLPSVAQPRAHAAIQSTTRRSSTRPKRQSTADLVAFSAPHDNHAGVSSSSSCPGSFGYPKQRATAESSSALRTNQADQQRPISRRHVFSHGIVDRTKRSRHDGEREETNMPHQQQQREHQQQQQWVPSRPVRRRGFTGVLSLALLAAAVASSDWLPWGLDGAQQQRPAANAAGLFGGWDSSENKDPINPFTLYGTVQKKYWIENLEGEKVVSRGKGFTVTACVSALDSAEETPELQALPIGAKVSVIGGASCAKDQGTDRDASCQSACDRACAGGMSSHREAVRRDTGYVVEGVDANRAVKQCSGQCVRECTKPGRFSSFVAPIRF